MIAATVRRLTAPPAAPIHGAGAIGLLNVRCLAILAAANAALGAVLVLGAGLTSLVSDGFVGAVESAISAAGFVLEVLVIALGVAGVLIAVVGVPAGLVVDRALRREAREWVHVLVFAAVGAVLAVAILLAVGVGTAALWAAIEGALGAGGARWWAGVAYRREQRAARSRVPDEDVGGAAGQPRPGQLLAGSDADR